MPRPPKAVDNVSRQHRDDYMRAISAARCVGTLREVRNHAMNDWSMGTEEWLDVDLACKERLDELQGGTA